MSKKKASATLLAFSILCASMLALPGSASASTFGGSFCSGHLKLCSHAKFVCGRC